MPDDPEAGGDSADMPDNPAAGADPRVDPPTLKNVIYETVRVGRRYGAYVVLFF